MTKLKLNLMFVLFVLIVSVSLSVFAQPTVENPVDGDGNDGGSGCYYCAKTWTTSGTKVTCAQVSGPGANSPEFRQGCSVVQGYTIGDVTVEGYCNMGPPCGNSTGGGYGGGWLRDDTADEDTDEQSTAILIFLMQQPRIVSLEELANFVGDVEDELGMNAERRLMAYRAKFAALMGREPRAGWVPIEGRRATR